MKYRFDMQQGSLTIGNRKIVIANYEGEVDVNDSILMESIRKMKASPLSQLAKPIKPAKRKRGN